MYFLYFIILEFDDVLSECVIIQGKTNFLLLCKGSVKEKWAIKSFSLFSNDL